MKRYYIVLENPRRIETHCVAKIWGEDVLFIAPLIYTGRRRSIPHTAISFHTADEAEHFLQTYKSRKWDFKHTNEHGHVKPLRLKIVKK